MSFLQETEKSAKQLGYLRKVDFQFMLTNSSNRRRYCLHKEINFGLAQITTLKQFEQMVPEN